MGWDEIQELGAAGIRFGSHMASHSHMNAPSSREMTLRTLLRRASHMPGFLRDPRARV